MERRPWTQRRNRRLPLHFRDVIPQPPPPLTLVHSETITLPVNASSSSAPPARLGSVIRRIFTTVRNVFGLLRRYEGTERPSFDPEEEVTLQDLSNDPACSNPSEPKSFYPYPNRSAFKLGDWHWNRGVHKSQASFRELMDIIDDPQFQLADVQNINWDKINKELGTDNDEEWLDEDAGWTRTPVTISVPHQFRRGIPGEPGAGPRNFTVQDFFHRSLVSIIKEKILGLGEQHHFHFEPYELHWQCKDTCDPIRTQGELYTSPAFIDAHRELQDSPGEPECDLPRVIAALMFWSDATQLTAFGNAKLWPLYMFFGNESKYRRSKPTCCLCEHVAYFQTVSSLSGVRFRFNLILFLLATGQFQGFRKHSNCRRESPQPSIYDALSSRIFPRAMESTFR